MTVPVIAYPADGATVPPVHAIKGMAMGGQTVHLWSNPVPGDLVEHDTTMAGEDGRFEFSGSSATGTPGTVARFQVRTATGDSDIVTVTVAAIPIGGPTYLPTWLAPGDVKEWLRIHAQDADDDDLILAACAQTEPYVQRCRGEWLGSDGTYRPDAETYRGAVMHAAREYRRRNSPAGIEAFGDAGTSFVARYDPDIEKALQTGSFAPPIIA